MPEASPEVVRVLTDNHRRFLAFLERRVHSRDVAEDLLQDAFVRGLARADTLRDPEAVVPWFFRVLRNALTDHYRHQAVEKRRTVPEDDAGALADPATLDPELFSEVCRCVGALAATLKPEYAQAIVRVDLSGASLSELATEAGITSNNATVRLHRARQALRKQLELSCGTCATHGCLDCHCGGPGRRAGPE
jgi:RNA polymerase sigma factor (sigma-70 family)